VQKIVNGNKVVPMGRQCHIPGFHTPLTAPVFG
jgi:hypothetical protein